MKTRWLGVLALAAMTNACAEATEEYPACEFCGAEAGADSGASVDALIDSPGDDTTTGDDTSVVVMDTGAADSAKTDATDAKSDAVDGALDSALDTGVGVDAMDSSTPDTLVADTGTVATDTGPFDVGSDTRDSAPLDTGPFDTGRLDTGTVAQDTGPFDTGSATDTNTCAVNTTASCGTCGRACSSTNVQTLDCNAGECWSTCQAGFSNCGRPVAPAPDDGCECEGTTCCGNACATKHSNGLGDSYFDCGALGTPGLATTYTQAMATAAATAWTPSGTVAGPGQCGNGGSASICMSKTTGDSCAVWCYTKALAGRVRLTTGSTACACPTTSDPTWN